jgi:glucose/mannose-6-phosphate isomerase
MPESEPTASLDAEAVAAADPSGQVFDVLALPEQLRDALFKAESAELPETDSPGGLVVAGMGGSGIGGRLARAILGDEASRPVLSSSEYMLPPWTTADTTVLLASYSGETEETLACYEAAGIIGAPRVVVTSGGTLAEAARADGVPVIPVAGGLQPRAAVAYMTVAALETAGPRMTPEIDVAAEGLEQLAGAWGPESPDDSEAKMLARALAGTVPVIAGSGLTAPIAGRWKTQVNENAKQPAFASALPELDHNEILGWARSPQYGPFSAIFLYDSDDTPRISRRIELTRELIAGGASGTHLIPTQGANAVERLFSLVLLGDLVSVYLAVLNGVDPLDIGAISELKERLSAPE